VRVQSDEFEPVPQAIRDSESPTTSAQLMDLSPQAAANPKGFPPRFGHRAAGGLFPGRKNVCGVGTAGASSVTCSDASSGTSPMNSGGLNLDHLTKPGGTVNAPAVGFQQGRTNISGHSRKLPARAQAHVIFFSNSSLKEKLE